MSGRRILTKILILWVLVLDTFIFTGYTSETELKFGPVAVLLSNEEEAYTMPVSTFINEVSFKVNVFNLHGDITRAKAVMAEILSQKPSLIFALGAKAAYIAKVWTRDRPDIPVVFAMVLNWQRYKLFEGQDNIAGIAYDVAPGTQFINMTLFSPNVQRIGVIYSKEHSSQTIEKAMESAEKLGLKLVARPISRPRNFKRAYKKISKQIEVFWIIADPVVYTLDNMSWLEEKCVKDSIICIGQSKNIAKLGVLLAMSPDTPNIGSQAASMAKSILLLNKNPKEIGVMPPLGTRLFLNVKTASKIGLVIEQYAMDMASEIIDK